jgi:hypothetical protein
MHATSRLPDAEFKRFNAARVSLTRNDDEQGTRLRQVSTVKQVVDGVSFEAQRIEITSFAIASGYGLLDVLCGDGISGSKDEEERSVLAEPLAAVSGLRCPSFIVCKRDRLAGSGVGWPHRDDHPSCRCGIDRDRRSRVEHESRPDNGRRS